MTEVINLATGEKLYYDLLPAEAVKMAYLQAEKDWNTWEYNERDVPIRWGKWTISCGDFTALKNK